ncbi:MAG TPA: hypothetical protein VNI34_00130 [Candidatus Nitrosotalea sp.]|nr:hypothetical protein [Candidatus Nitrosotalea sp.]
MAARLDDLNASPCAVRSQMSVSAVPHRLQLWLLGLRGRSLVLEGGGLSSLPERSRLEVGIPIVGPRSILCALSLHGPGEVGETILRGWMRMLSHPVDGGVSLRFEGRSSNSRCGAGESEVAHDLLALIAQRSQLR